MAWGWRVGTGRRCPGGGGIPAGWVLQEDRHEQMPGEEVNLTEMSTTGQ